MKTTPTLRRIACIALLALFQISFMKAQINPCPYTLTNGLNCDINVFVEFRDINCGTICPWSIPVTLVPGAVIQVGDAACCAAGIFDMIIYLVDIDSQPVVPAWPFVEINSSGPTCIGGNLSNSGAVPPAASCPGPAVWNMNINPGAGTVIIN